MYRYIDNSEYLSTKAVAQRGSVSEIALLKSFVKHTVKGLPCRCLFCKFSGTFERLLMPSSVKLKQKRYPMSKATIQV